MVMPPLKSSKLVSASNSKGDGRRGNMSFGAGDGSNNNNNNNNNNYVASLLSQTSSDRTVGYNSCNHLPKLINNLNVLRLNSMLCDVEIVVDGVYIPAHRAVLAASSPYFNAMFTSDLCEKDQRSVELHSVSAMVLSMLVDFIYTGDIELNQNNVQEIMIAADMIGLDDVVMGCSEYLIKELHAVNAAGIYRFADLHNWRELKTASFHYIQKNFPEIIDEEEIYELSKDQMIEFLVSEHLILDSEFQVFQAAMRWITHDIKERRRYVFEILKCIRLSLLPLGLLEQAISDCSDSSLRIALKSIYMDLISKKGCLVPLDVHPRIGTKKHIFIVGGSKREFNVMNRCYETCYETCLVTVERFDTHKNEWCKVPNMTMSRTVPGVASLNGNIYVVGGEHGSTCLACGECYDPHKNAWTKIASMVIPRCEFGLCAWNGFLIAIGGWVGGDLDDIGGSIERYSPRDDTWTIVGSLPEPRFSMGVVSYDGLIYLVGGCTKYQRFSRELVSYNPVTQEWDDSLPPMSEPRSQMGVAILDDCLYVVGGNYRSDVLSSVEKYSFKKRKWTTLPSLSVGRSGPAVAAVDGSLYVIGGHEMVANPFYRAQFTIASVECFNPHSMAWSMCPPLPESRGEAGAVVL